MATDYFLRCGYGMHLFNYEQQEEMLEELNQIRYNFYHFGNDEMRAYRRYAQKEIKAWNARWKDTRLLETILSFSQKS